MMILLYKFEMNKRLRQCPVCNQALDIVEYHCPACDITVRGRFGIGDLAALTPAQQEFVKVFICCGGNIKEVEKRLKISYPTVKNRLAEIATFLCDESPEEDYNDVLNEISEGNLSVEEALKKLEKNRR